jgi:hypothetical protein
MASQPPQFHPHRRRDHQPVERVARGAGLRRRQAADRVLYFVGEEHSQSQYTDAQAAAVWERFSQLAERWEVPDAPHDAPAGAGALIDRRNFLFQ